MRHIESWKQCRDPKVVERVADTNGCKRRHGAGDHEIIEAPNGDHFAYYNRELSTGVACKLFKWFVDHKFVMVAVVAFLGYIAWMA